MLLVAANFSTPQSDSKADFVIASPPAVTGGRGNLIVKTDRHNQTELGLAMTFETGFFLMVLVLSLLNREQSLLMNAVVPVIYLAIKNQSAKKTLTTLWKLTAAISIIYLSVLKLTGQYIVIDTISYLRNNYGLSENVYTFSQNIPFILQSIIYAHKAFIMDLLHHRWWLAVTLTGTIGAAFALKRRKTIDSIMFASAIGSYAAIFIYPSFSYKYFFPMAISLIYFTISLICSIDNHYRSHSSA